MSADSFYTPRRWADRLVARVTRRSPKRIADFAAGDGTLIEAAEANWPDAKLIATDNDRRAVKRLRQRCRTWTVKLIDFESSRSREELRKTLSPIDLVLLNPPFSHRGGERVAVSVDGAYITCSRPMAFVINSIPFLSDRGEILAVLPRSSLRSEKDAAARWQLTKHFNISSYDELPRGEFAGCAAMAMIVGFSRREQPTKASRTVIPLSNWVVERGSCQMHAARRSRAANSLPLVHTKNLQNSSVAGATMRVRADRFHVGPGVLLPRVGRPSQLKIVPVDSNFRAVLSDCVMIVRTSTLAEASGLVQLFRSRWERLESLYSATGAPYITIAALKSFVGQLTPSNSGVTEPACSTDGLRQLVHGVPENTGHR